MSQTEHYHYKTNIGNIAVGENWLQCRKQSLPRDMLVTTSTDIRAYRYIHAILLTSKTPRS